MDILFRNSRLVDRSSFSEVVSSAVEVSSTRTISTLTLATASGTSQSGVSTVNLGSGAAGAPKFADSGAWSARLGQGLEALVNSALKGKGAMGAQGGGDFNDTEIARAVVYLANAGGGKFEEPKPADVAVK